MAKLDSILGKAVSSPDGGETWDFQCPGIDGSKCGDPVSGRPYFSVSWPNRKVATARGREHLEEHKAGPAIAALRDEVTMAENNDPGYEKVKPETKQAELDALLAKVRVSPMHEFMDKHGLAVHPETKLAVSVEDL